MLNPPTGTITFLFTDIEGSTKRWEQHPQAMQGAVERHDAILRRVIEANGGYVFKTVGDAFCAAFPTALGALQAALDAQRSMQGEEWGETDPIRVRVGLHTGTAQERESDYFGPVLNRVARLMSAGHGGQVLLSLATQELVRDCLPHGVELRDLGEHSLKDLARPERIYQVAATELATEFPTLKTLDARPNNLPIQPTPLIGREKEVGEVVALLRRPDVALVTLTGPGGIGKTRLGLQVGAELLDDFKDGVWLVDLAPLSDPDLVIPTIAQSLGVKEVAGQQVTETLKAYLHDKHILLVLDNFEQVVAAATKVVQLLAGCLNVKVLVTSRVPLRVRGEREYGVPSLQLPNPKQLPSLERLTQYEAVRMFIERAQSVKADFEVNNENAPAVAEICARLDGLPLAIELAAARVRLLPPQALLTRLESRLKLLIGGARDLPARQQTLRGTIEWSYELLDSGEKQLFSRLAVFLGGRTLEAIEAVCNADGDLEMDALEGVDSLVSKSLLRQEEGIDGEPRLVMLETVHEYAREKLEERGEAKDLKGHHAAYFLQLAEQAEPHLRGREQLHWLTRLEAERGNLRAALEWTLTRDVTTSEHSKADTGRLETGLRMAGALQRFWEMHGPTSEGLGWLDRALLVAEGVSPVLRAKLFTGAGTLAWRQGKFAEAAEYHKSALTLYQKLGDKKGAAFATNNIGTQAYCQGDFGTARTLFEKALAFYREIDDRWGIGMMHNNLGEVARFKEDYEAAGALYEEALAFWKEEGDRLGTALALDNLGYVAHHKGDSTKAANLFTQALVIYSETRDKMRISTAMLGLGLVLGARGEIRRAGRLLGAGEAVREESGSPLSTADQREYDQGLALIRSKADEATLAAAWAEGRAMSLEQAIAYALEGTEHD